MSKLFFSTILLLALGLTACNTTERYALNNQAARAWLAANPASGNSRIAGHWQPDDAGWGKAKIEQAGNRVTGTIGAYSIEGHVQGDNLYLLMSDGGWVYYSAVLKKKGDVLSGFYSAHVPFSTQDQETFVLVRVKN